MTRQSRCFNGRRENVIAKKPTIVVIYKNPHCSSSSKRFIKPVNVKKCLSLTRKSRKLQFVGGSTLMPELVPEEEE